MSTTLAYTLEQAETDLRGAYFLIRTSRRTSWKSVNKARMIMEAMRRMGIKKWELTNAMYCLKNLDCNRCNKNVDGIPCYEIGKRRKAGLHD